MPAKTNQKIIEKAMQDMASKYLDLVWYARSGENIDDPIHGSAILKSRAVIEKKYFNDTNELFKDETNWQHGFNSGMLACIRYLWSIKDEGIEHANQEFPELYT